MICRSNKNLSHLENKRDSWVPCWMFHSTQENHSCFCLCFWTGDTCLGPCLWTLKPFYYFTFYYHVSLCPSLFFRSFSYELLGRTINTKQQTNLNFFGLVGEKIPSWALEMLQQVYEDDNMFPIRVLRGTRNSGVGALSVNRTAVNVMWVRQMAWADHWLTVWVITNQLDMKKETAWMIVTEDLVI